MAGKATEEERKDEECEKVDEDGRNRLKNATYIKEI